MKGKGVPDLHGRGMGDELVKVIVDIPRNLNSEQRRLIEEFAIACGEDINKKEGLTDKIKKAFK